MFRKLAQLLLFLHLLAVEAQPTTTTGGCQQVVEGPGRWTCACSAQVDTCERLEFRWPDKSGQARLVQTSRAGQRFQVSQLDELDEDLSLSSATLKVQLQKKQQTIMGWGGAFTDATGINLERAGEKLAAEILESYYGRQGLQYNFGRVPIAGSDFSARAYSYDDTPGDQADFKLSNWNLTEEDFRYKIPHLKRAKELVEARGEQLKLFASPWSPPKWMKTNRNFVQGELLQDDKVMRSYANYLAKFYQAYEREGLRFWGGTVQNEPISALNPSYFFNSLQFHTAQQARFIGKFLGPALESQLGYNRSNFKLMVGDDNLGLINLQVPQLMQSKEVQRYVSGLAFHWYLSGAYVPYEALSQVYEAIKDKVEFALMTEACNGWHPLEPKVELGSWARGEAYAADIMEDLRRQASGWIDWNMALDMRGGPNWANNFVDAPILVDQEEGKIYKQPMYYALAHFTRFFRPGARRVDVNHHNDTADLLAVSVLDEASGHVIVNLLNKSPNKMRIELKIDATSAANADDESSSTQLKPFVVDAKSINTIVYKL